MVIIFPISIQACVTIQINYTHGKAVWSETLVMMGYCWSCPVWYEHSQSSVSLLLHMMAAHLPARQLFSHCASKRQCPVNSHGVLCQNKLTHQSSACQRRVTVLSLEQRRLPVYVWPPPPPPQTPPHSLTSHFLSLSASSESQTDKTTWQTTGQ